MREGVTILFIRVSENRVFLINDYWVIIPLILAVDIFIIVKVKKNRAIKKLESERLRYKAGQWKVFYDSTGHLIAALQVKGGDKIVVDLVDDYIDVEHNNCVVEEGIFYVNHEKLRKLVSDLYPYKVRNGVIFITKAALCQLAHLYQVHLPINPILLLQTAVTISDWYKFGIGFIAAIFILGIPFPLLLLYRASSLPKIISLMSWSFGVYLAVRDPSFLTLPVDRVTNPMYIIGSRIPHHTDLVVINIQNNNRGVAIKLPVSYECSLPTQIMYNPKCKPGLSQLADIVEEANIPLNYEEVVNMNDVTQLPRVKFSDQLSFGKSIDKKPTTNPRLRGTKSIKKQAKTVKFLEKFKDPEIISNVDEWDITKPTQEDKIKIQDEEL